MGEKPSLFSNDPHNPIDQVSWDDAQQFIAKLNQHFPNLNACLPNEAQWEYACRAGMTTAFSYGENITPEQVNYNGTFPYARAEQGLNRQRTVPVASLPPNAWGLYETHGNVLEWCEDWYGEYENRSQRDPTGPQTGARRVLRGGSWLDNGWDVRCAYRGRIEPGARNYGLGFRLALGQKAAKSEAPAGEPRGTRGGKTGAVNVEKTTFANRLRNLIKSK